MPYNSIPALILPFILEYKINCVIEGKPIQFIKKWKSAIKIRSYFLIAWSGIAFFWMENSGSFMNNG